MHPKLKVKKTKLPKLESEATDTGKRNMSKTRKRSTSNSRNRKRNAKLTRKQNSRLFLFLHEHHAFALFLKLGIKILSFIGTAKHLNRECAVPQLFQPFCCCCCCCCCLLLSVRLSLILFLLCFFLFVCLFFAQPGFVFC